MVSPYKKSICENLCKKFKMKKPTMMGRYEDGQVLCQICSIWISYLGCHDKNRKPATEDTEGLFCNCCNYKVRTKPRNKKYKERLYEKNKEIQAKHITDSDTLIDKHSIAKKATHLANKIKKLKLELMKPKISLTPCPSCKLTPKDNKDAIKLFGLRYNGTRRQSHCSKCRGSDRRLKHEINDESNKKGITKNHIPKSKIQNSEDGIGRLAEEMINEYLADKKFINNQLRKILTAEFVKVKSLSKMFEMHPDRSEKEIVRHIITDQRLPSKLKKLENEGALHSNIECSLGIALFATKYCNWDGEKSKENDVIVLAKSISKYLKIDTELNHRFEGLKN